jgi:carbonic anhydrase/acetyltransferase-like protein (isoleucine patch superfamily)
MCCLEELERNMSSNRAYEFQREKVAPNAFIAPNATVLGDVEVGEEASIWYGAIVRGDTAPIRIGQQTNIQDLCVLHADPGFPCSLGKRVTVGHGAIVHGATIEDDVLIGMRAVVMNGARVGAGSIVGVGAVVTEGMVVPPNSVVLGVPAQVKRACEARDVERIHHAARHYVAAALEVITQTLETQELYEDRLKAKLDEEARLDYARAEGLEQGRKERERIDLLRWEQIGQIRLLEDLLKMLPTASEELAKLGLEQLAMRLAELQRLFREQIE